MTPMPPTLWQRLTTLEPALVRGVIFALVYVIGIVGFNVTDVGEKIVGAWTAIFAVLPLIQAWWTRSAVTPSSTVVASVALDGQVEAGPASPVPTGDLVYVQAIEPHDPAKVDNREPHPYEYEDFED